MGGKLSCAAGRYKPAHSLHANAKSTASEASDPYLYTAGRWLHQDELQRQSRVLQFSFPRLCQKAAGLCPGARVASYEKKEGGYNKVFVFTLDTGKRIVARIPTRVAGPPRLTVNSEVATITYLQSKTSLPIPKILGWSDDPTNPVGTEYILQEHVDGVLLHEQWPLMNSLQHMLCVKDLSKKIKEMASLDFPAYGNIYFADAPISEDLKFPLEDAFCIGPYCNPLFWNCTPEEAALYAGPSPNCGPGKNLTEYKSGLIDTAFSRIPSEQVISSDHLPFRGTVQDHVRLLSACRETMQVLAEDERIQAAAASALVHPDYHKRNIFVSPDNPRTVTGLIDWQLACIEPAFIYADSTPDFAAFPDETPAGDERDANRPTTKEGQDITKDVSICHQTYDVIVSRTIPKMRLGMSLDPIFFRLFHYCFTSWRDGAPAIRQELIDLKDLWTELELPGDCPYHPSEEELRDHARQYEDFKTIQKLKMWLKMSLQTTSDGWVPNEVWDAAREANRAAYAQWMEVARASEACGGDVTIRKADMLWPFDAR